MKVYVSGPIDPTNKAATDDWRTKAVDYFQRNGIATINPCRNKAVYDPGAFTPQEIILRDLKDVEEADVILCNFNELSPHRLSIGTFMEIMAAYELRKPVVVVAQDPRIYEHPWINAMSVRRFKRLDQGLEYITNFWGD